MAQEHDYIRPEWRKGKAGRNTNQQPYSAMIRYAKELAFDGSCVSIQEKDETDGSKLEATKFTNPHGLEVNGAYDTNKLEKDKIYSLCPQKNEPREYKIQFVVKVTDEVTPDFEVESELICPGGQTINRTDKLSEKRKNKWVGLNVGEFANVNPEKVYFGFKTTDATTEKKGLIVVGAVIVAVGVVPKPVAMATVATN